MAITPNPLINDESTLLLNQDSTTFQIYFKDLSKNVLNYITGNGDKGDDGFLQINDNFDVNTDVYISLYDSNTGAPTETKKFGTGGLTGINDDSLAGVAGTDRYHDHQVLYY